MKWNHYPNRKYALFHITHEKSYDKCSIYFWIDKRKLRIKKIPKEKFKYNQESFSMYSSTRSKCEDKHIKVIIKNFQRLLNKIY